MLVIFYKLFVASINVCLFLRFQSDHYTAEFYAAARALGGCHVIVMSGEPEIHLY